MIESESVTVMTVIRNIREERLALIIKQVEQELDDAKKARDEARKALDEAQANVDLLEVDYQLLTNEPEKDPVTKIELEIPPKPDGSQLVADKQGDLIDTTSSSNHEPIIKPEKEFWEKDGFQWRQFLPDFIEQQDRFFTLNDVIIALKIDNQQRQKVYATISSALSVLAKDGKKIVSHTIPSVRGQLYGSPSFFEEDGKVKHKYVDELLQKQGQILL